MTCQRTLRALVVGAALALSIPTASAQPESTYRVGPKDLLEIKVFEVPELNVDRRIDDNGSIELPLVGPVSLTNLTVEQVRDKLRALLEARYMRRASVSVVIKEFQNQPISVIGAVAKPGPLPSSGRWTLLQAISEVGGLTASAGKKLYVLRHADNGLNDQLEINTDELMIRSDPRWNIAIYPNDVINVPPQVTVKVFVLGEVKNPGAIEFSSGDQISLLAVIAKAGGLTDRASRGSIRIRRRGPDGKEVEFAVPYRRMLAGKEPDPILQPNDLVIVKESFL